MTRLRLVMAWQQAAWSRDTLKLPPLAEVLGEDADAPPQAPRHMGHRLYAAFATYQEARAAGR